MIPVSNTHVFVHTYTPYSISKVALLFHTIQMYSQGINLIVFVIAKVIMAEDDSFE